MTIDEAVAHAREKADENSECWRHCTSNEDCETCEQEHKQLAEWLEELKSYRASVLSGDMTQKMLKEAYNKAIDDFAEKLKRENKETIPTHSGYCRMSFDEVVDEIAEQLKAGLKYEM